MGEKLLSDSYENFLSVITVFLWAMEMAHFYHVATVKLWLGYELGFWEGIC